MTEAERIERAARAIYEGRNGKGCKPWSLQTKAHKEPYLHDAKAALAAGIGGDVVVPREPTQAMIDAALALDAVSHGVLVPASPADAYDAMISAAEMEG